MSAFDLGTKFEYVANTKGGTQMCVVAMYPEGVYVRNPPSGSGFVEGSAVSEEEFDTRAKAYLEKMES